MLVVALLYWPPTFFGAGSSDSSANSQKECYLAAGVLVAADILVVGDGTWSQCSEVFLHQKILALTLSLCDREFWEWLCWKYVTTWLHFPFISLHFILSKSLYLILSLDLILSYLIFAFISLSIVLSHLWSLDHSGLLSMCSAIAPFASNCFHTVTPRFWLFCSDFPVFHYSGACDS